MQTVYVKDTTVTGKNALMTGAGYTGATTVSTGAKKNAVMKDAEKQPVKNTTNDKVPAQGSAEYRTEYNYIEVYLIKATNIERKAAMSSLIEKAVHTFLSDTKALRVAYQDAVKL